MPPNPGDDGSGSPFGTGFRSHCTSDARRLGSKRVALKDGCRRTKTPMRAGSTPKAIQRARHDLKRKEHTAKVGRSSWAHMASAGPRLTGLALVPGSDRPLGGPMAAPWASSLGLPVGLKPAILETMLGSSRAGVQVNREAARPGKA